MYKSLMFVRFSLSDRITHWVYAVVVIILAATGFSQLAAMNPVSLVIFRILGGIEQARNVHHIFGFVFLVISLYLIGAVAYRVFILEKTIALIPGYRDVRQIVQTYRYSLGITKKKPSVTRSTLSKKMLFWFLTWISAIMVFSGFILLNPIAVTTFLPGMIIPIAKTIHGLEAVLAIVALLIWHTYFLLLKQLDAAIVAVEPEFKKANLIENPIDTVDVFDGRTITPPTRKAIEFYWRYNLPAYLLFSGALIAGSLYFITFESTSPLTFLNPEKVAVYSPSQQEINTRLASSSGTFPPMKQSSPSVALHSWTSCINMVFLTNCVPCHEQVTDVNLNLRDYQSIADSGIITPKDPQNSKLLNTLNDEVHVDICTDKILEEIYEWAIAGFPHTNIPPAYEEQFLKLTWASDIKPIITKNCISCHGANATHGLDFRSYYSLIDSGVISFSSPVESTIVIRTGENAHPGNLSESDLLKLHEWVWHGAKSGMSAEDASREYWKSLFSNEMRTPVPASSSEKSTITWDSAIADLFKSNCISCHGAVAVGGVKLDSYDSAIAPVSIIPGDPDSSPVVITMKSGNHPALFSEAELDKIIQWISSGAPEKSGAVIKTTPEESAPSFSEMKAKWDATIGDILAKSCGSCHGASAIAGLDVTSFEKIMDSGTIVPGNPDGSSIVNKMESGSHPATLSQTEIAALREWIALNK